MTKLIFTTPLFKNQSFKIPEGKTTVGRAFGNTLIIQHDTVSQNHCEILLHAGEVIIRDRTSTNGTWVDDIRVKGQTCMRHGQRIRFGQVEARLELPPPSFEDQHTEVTAIHLLPRLTAESPKPAALTAVIIRPQPCHHCTVDLLASSAK
ncbi:MAG TPA: FHA domain-containing protein [Verrucomicrobiae bacterium]|nr:FHA domain-containing protein [Verrucomicrobiae bacterium]